MKKIVIILLLTIPVIVCAQKSITSHKSSVTPKSTQKDVAKNKDSEENFGEILSSYTYYMGQITLTWKTTKSTTNEKLLFYVGNVIKENKSLYYVNVFHGGFGFDIDSSITLEEPLAREWYESLLKLDEIRKKPVPEGAEVVYSYRNDKNMIIDFKENRYEIRLNSLKNDKIFASDIKPMISKLEECFSKIKLLKSKESLKSLESLNSNK